MSSAIFQRFKERSGFQMTAPEEAVEPRPQIDALGQEEPPDAQSKTGIAATANAITNELVKSYGFEYGDDGWSWSFDKIQQSFEEEPFWTTLDYLTLAVPVARWGGALGKVMIGGGPIGKAYEAGRFAGRAPTSKAGKVVSRLGAGDELAAAAERTINTPGRLNRISNPITLNIDDEYMQWADEFGMRPWERRGIAQMYDRERRLEMAITEKEGEAAILAWNRSGLDKATQEKGYRFLETGVDAADAQVARELGDAGAKAYEKTFAFRNRIHNEAWDLGLISDETYARNLKTYAPRLYAEWEKLKGAGWAADDALRKVSGTQTGRNRFRGRKAEAPDPELTQILDPAAGIDAIARAGHIIATQRYAQRLAGSVIAKKGEDLAPIVRGIADSGDIVKARMMGIVPTGKIRVTDQDVAAHLMGLKDEFATADKLGVTNSDAILRRAGWTRMDDLLEQHKAGKYLDRVPEELRDKWIDPAVGRDIAGIVKWSYQEPDFVKKLYYTTLGLFKATKTAYNPATFVRNWLGGVVHNHLLEGGAPKFFPSRAWKSFHADDADYRAFMESGHANASSMAEVREALAQAGVKWRIDRPATSIDFLGDAPIAKWMQRGAGFMESMYRGIDELWKLEGWLGKRDEMLKAGAGADEAAAYASAEVSKFMPTFVTSSPIGNAARQVIPFASFTTEALRIWKNALAEKPHLAYFWNHIAEGASHAFGAMAGFSEEDLENAKSGLPGYMNNKKLLALPFNMDGKPMFIDLSYVIPLANLVEAERGERLFFNELYDVTSNPAIALGTAAATGIEPFGRRPVEPRFTERQLGISVDNPTARQAIGLAEYAISTLSPPLAPWGYAGTNLLEAVRGQRSPQTGSELEPSIVRTVLANVAGLRTYEANVSSQVANVQREQMKRNERTSREWDRYEWAHANGDVSAMEESRKRLVSMKLEDGSPSEEAESWFARGLDRHKPGTSANLSTKQIEEVLARSAKIGSLSEDEKRLQSELLLRYHKRTSSGRKPKKAEARP